MIRTAGKYAPFILATCAFLLCAGCATLGPGTGSETTNGYVTGKVVDSAGFPASDVSVKLLPALYNPLADAPVPDSLVRFTDEAGMYRITFPGSGLFNLEATFPTTSDKALITGIATANGLKVVAPDGALKHTGAIKIILPDSADSKNGYIYIPGSTLWAPVANGSAVISGVPAGIIPAVYFADTADSTRNRIVRTGFMVPPLSTVEIADYQNWKFSRKLLLNTTATGAAVSAACVDFPVLVRLTSATFDFSQAGVDGKDLRFAKPDGAPLAYEIERWDSVLRKAEIWVRVDTVHGNDGTQFIIMYWGVDSTRSPQASATPASNSTAVWDTAAGFSAVWHLDETANTLSNGYRDATASGLHLTGIGATPAIEGAVGRARAFDSTVDYLSGPAPSHLSGNASFTVMFWVQSGPMKPENLMGNRVDFLDIGDKTSEKKFCHFLLWPNYTAQFGFSEIFVSVEPCPDSTAKLAQNIFSFSQNAGIWTNVVTVYDSAAGSLATYINGKLTDRDTVSGIAMDWAAGIRMGMPCLPGDAHFIGNLDEVRIYGRTLASGEIKLNYEAQRSVSALVKFQ